MAEIDFVAKFESREIDQFLKKLTKNTKEVKESRDRYAKFISIYVFQDIDQHFQDEMGPSGAWSKWSKPYSEFMQRIGKGSNKILQDTGRMRNAITPIKDGGNVRTKKGVIIWYNPTPYAQAHDEGKKMPLRSFMWLSNNAFDKLSAATLKYITEM